MSVKVLIAEDDVDYREMIHCCLEMKGFEVIFADNGRDAIELAEEDKPHVILMDLNLPVLDGWEAIRKIKRNHSTADIPIVVVSAYCRDEELKEEALAAGAVKCLTKPVNIEKLPALIADYALH